ncbi:MAG: DUF58 domain-containing protein, partial [Algoriphagus sp.]
IFTSLKELLGMERHVQFFSLIARKQKVKSILGGRHESKLRGRGLDFEETRHYVQGDDIRNIDWKVTARTRETHTRVFTEEKEKPAMIVVDQTNSMFFGSKSRTKSVVAAELAAIAAFRVLKQGDRVGGIVFSDDGIDIIQPKRDRRNILRFLEKVVNRNHDLAKPHSTDYQDTLKEVSKKVRNIVTHDYLVVLISDFHRYSPDVTRFISQIAQHNDVVLVKVFDPLERDIPKIKFVAGDFDTQVTVDGGKKTLRSSFQTGFDEDFQSFSAQMKKHRVPIISLDTVVPIDEQMKSVFKKARK